MKYIFIILSILIVFKANSQNAIWYDNTNSPLPFAALIDDVEFIDSTTWMYSQLHNSIISYKNGDWNFFDNETTPTIPTVGGLWDMEAASSDTLWMCIGSSGIYKYVISTNIMTPLSGTSNAKDMVLDGKNIWFTKLSEHAIYQFDGSSMNQYDYTFTNLPDTSFMDIEKGLNNDIWTITAEQLVKFDGTTWTTYDLPMTISANTYATKIDIDNNGDVWVKEVGEYLMRFDGTNWTTYNMSTSSIPGNDVQTLYVAKNGDIWMGIANVGLVQYDGTNFTLIDVVALTGWEDNSYTNINEDIYGNIWVAAYKYIFIYNPNGLQGYVTVNENTSDLMKVYPNPSQNGVYEIITDEAQFIYEVYSLDGKLVKKGSTSGRINLENQPNGIYILHVTTSYGTVKSKLVIE